MNKNNSLFSLLVNHKKNIFFGIIGLTIVNGIMLIIPLIIGDVTMELTAIKSSQNSTDVIRKSAFYLLICGIIETS